MIETSVFLMLLLIRIARQRKRAKVILLAILTITVILFGRIWTIIMGNVSYFLQTLDLKIQL
jgi:prolipoprotein diacylglyceryltransferase